MEILKADKQQGLYCLWNSRGAEVTETLFFNLILKSIVDDSNGWDPGFFDWYHEDEINFVDWQRIEVEVWPMVIVK
ncbi:hypothetical protein BLL40_05160 [Domibacillus mangrovi]|uniref:Uncharacterized protein n=1 Tax=Domibacillus mangrovi TaxID=1714354 RepID=A0A1Q5P5A0_9BACI|nr:hypothetical protein [Domibacillus mangrovi]OKL37373.1 hypothetical protein BLL40_05160 [Domibacillus mangrovi]